MNQEKLMQLIQKASFAVYDTKLFLDTHPNCQEALDYYHEMKKLRDKAWNEYTENYGSLSAEDVTNREYWDWNQRVWPWEGGNC